MIAASFPRTTPDMAATATSGATSDLRVTCAVRLIDRRTGATHRINGSPLVLYIRNPQEAVAELLSGRDAEIWETHTEPLGHGCGA